MLSNILSSFGGTTISMAMLLVKATLILLVALGITLSMQRASAGARHLGRQRIGIATGAERPLPHKQLAGTAHSCEAAGVAACRGRGPTGPLTGPTASERKPVQSERAVHRTG